MQTKYIITIKANKKDVLGGKSENIRYACKITDQQSIFRHADWAFNVNEATAFSSVEDAEEWFLMNKHHLFTDIEKWYDFDMSSITIVKREYTAVKMLEV